LSLYTRSKKGYKAVKSLFGKEVDIPEEWRVKRFDQIGQIIGGGTPDSSNKEYWNGEILWAVPTDITKLQTNEIRDTQRKITKQGLDNSSAKLLPSGAILITSRATIGECAIAAKPISTNQGFQSIVCSDGFDKLFVFYSIKYGKNMLLRLSYGTTFLEISKNEIKKTVLSIPDSLDEQRRIASILSGIDALIESTRRVTGKAELLKQGLMQELLTRGIGHTKFKAVKSLFGKDVEIPEEWEAKTFDDVFEFLSTATNSRSDLRVRGDVNYIHYGDIHTKWKVFLDCKNKEIPFIDKEKVKSIPLLKDGDVVIADASEDHEGSGASILLKNVNGRKIVSGLHTIAIRDTKGVTVADFRAYLTSMSFVKTQIVARVTGISVYGLSKKSLKQIIILLPPLPEQRRIASILSGVDAYIQKNKEYCEKLERLKKGLMQKLLTGQIRVKV